MTDPTPTPAAPDWRELCEALLRGLDENRHPEVRYPGHLRLVMSSARAALATTPPAPPLEPCGCPTPGACSCPTAPIVPPELIRALELAEAALMDIGETLPGSGALRPRISRALLTWREHATPPVPTREAAPGAELSDEELLQTYGKAKRDHCYEGPSDDWPKRAERAAIICGLRAVWARAQAAREAAPLPQAPTDEDLDDLCAEFSFLTDDDESRDSLIEMFRTVLARWGGAAVPVPVSEPVGFFPVEYADADGEGIRILMEPADETGRVCWTVRNSRHVNPCREFATPEEAYAAHRTAADQQEGRDAAAGEVQP
jgi:hypothetical protein